MSEAAGPILLRVVIVDDHAMFRSGVRHDIGDRVHLVGEGEDVPTAVAAILAAAPDVVLLDVHLPGGTTRPGGREVLQRCADLLAAEPPVRFLALSVSDAAEDVIAVIRAGARGYVTKQELDDTLLMAIQRVLAGDIYMSGKLQARLAAHFVAGPTLATRSTCEGLSDRELEVFRLIGEGYGTREMAEKLYLSVKTIETYRAHIKEKLDLQDANELLRAAIRWANAQR